MRNLLMIFILLISASATASINQDLQNFFDGLGYSSNVTSAEAYQGQSAGYYTGGSLYARHSVRNFQIASLTLPSVRAGCGGIDLFTGGFSFINSQQLQEMMKNIMNNAGSYAFMLALKSMSPEISTVTEYAESLANDINRMNINSCEVAAGLVGSVWPKTQVAQQQVCQTIGTSKGLFSDWAAAKQGCGSGGAQTSTFNSAQNDPRFQNLILDNTNVVWKTLKQNGWTASDPQLAELLMSISGTVIIKKQGNNDDANQDFKTFPSKVHEQDFLKALLHGGTTKIYHCDEYDKCLNLSQDYTITISADKAFESQVRNTLRQMVEKIKSDTALTSAEKGFLNSTTLPVYKMLNVQSAMQHGSGTINVEQYSDVIAIDILFQYLQENLFVVKAALSTASYPPSQLEVLEKGITDALTGLRAEQANTYRKISMTLQMVQETQFFEQLLSGELSADLSSSLKWSKELN